MFFLTSSGVAVGFAPSFESAGLRVETLSFIFSPKSQAQRELMGLSHEIARYINEYLGPAVQRCGSVGATLNALRVRLETNEVTDDSCVDLCWQVREAIRTEFFKIKYPAAPPLSLLALVSKTEVLFAGIPQELRATRCPFYFPGARVSIPHENGIDRRAGTTLQLRIRAVEGGSITEALAHLDGERGGGFRWVQTAALAPLHGLLTPANPPSSSRAARPLAPSMPTLAPRPSSTAVYGSPTVASMPALVMMDSSPQNPAQNSVHVPVAEQIVAKSRKTQQPKASRSAKQPKQPQQTKEDPSSVVPHVGREGSFSEIIQKNDSSCRTGDQAGDEQSKPRKEEHRPHRTPTQVITQDLLPPTFVPDALRSVSPPPRKRLRRNIDESLSVASGSLAAAAEHMLKDSGRNSVVNMGNAYSSSMTFGRRTAMTASQTMSDKAASSRIRCSDSEAYAEPTSLAMPDSELVDSKTLQSNETMRCTRSFSALTDRVITIERLVARRENVSCGGVIEYCVKWAGADWEHCSWESREALLRDVPGLVLEFDTRHPEKPSKAYGVLRQLPEGEEKDHERRMREKRMREEQNRADIERKRKEMECPVLIPTWAELPFLEINISGMVLQLRRNEGTLHADASAAARDCKKRRARFKQEFPEESARLILPTKSEVAAKERNEAKLTIERSAQERKAYGMQLINFPRGIGCVLRDDLATPVSRKVVEAAPPSWESYFLGLGLDCRNWQRDLPPDVPTAADHIQRSMNHARFAAGEQSRTREDDRLSRLIKTSSQGESTDMMDGKWRTETGLLCKGQKGQSEKEDVSKSPSLLASDDYNATSAVFTVESLSVLDPIVREVLSSASYRMVSPPSSQDQTRTPSNPGRRLLRDRNRAFGQALQSALNLSDTAETAYDPVWCCRRSIDEARNH